MDWSKAKSILIAVLLVTNITLIMVYGIQYEREQKQDSKVFEYTISILEKNNVYIDTDIPEKAGKVPVLNVAYDTFVSSKADIAIASVPYLKEEEQTEDNYKKVSDDFISQCGLMTEYVVFSGVYEEDGKQFVRYYCQYKEMPVVDSYMTCIFEDGKMIDFKRNWLEPKQEGETKLELIMPVTALLKFMTQRETEDPIHIEKMKLTYRVDDSDFSEEKLAYDTAFPTWKIVYNGGSVEYIQAFEL